MIFARHVVNLSIYKFHHHQQAHGFNRKVSATKMHRVQASLEMTAFLGARLARLTTYVLA
jgi:hypothetical protein